MTPRRDRQDGVRARQPGRGGARAARRRVARAVELPRADRLRYAHAAQAEDLLRSQRLLPDVVELELTTPPGFSSAADLRALLSAAVHDLEEKHQQEIAAQGRRSLGVARVLAQNPFTRPPAGEPRFELKPRIAARDKWKRVEGILRLKSSSASTETPGSSDAQEHGTWCSRQARTSCASSTACSALEPSSARHLASSVRSGRSRSASVLVVCAKRGFVAYPVVRPC